MSNSLTLELVSNGPIQYQNVSLAAHVKKPLEKFLFKKKLNEGAIPLEYFENKKINAKDEVFIFDRSHLSYRDSALIDNSKFKTFIGGSLSTQYKEVLITHRTGISNQGAEVPLFYKHALKSNTVEVDIKISSNIEIDTPFIYKIDIENNGLYTNASNFFDKRSGRYKIVYIEEVDSEGNSQTSLLQIRPVISEATWQDVDQSTGKINSSVDKYTREQTSSGYKYYLNGNEKYYWTPESTNLLFIKEILGDQSNESWTPVISNGNAYRNVSGRGYRYYISEYNQQAFYPAKPYSNSSQKTMQFVNSNILDSNLKKIEIENNLPIDIFVYDEDGSLIDIFTSNESKEDLSLNGIQYKTKVIEGYDSESGLIYLNTTLDSNYTYKCDAFYRKQEFELKELNLNPVLNKNNRHHKFVIYCIPNASIWERSIHYLVVDENDIIINCSQSVGLTYPSLQGEFEDKINDLSVIGKSFSYGEDSFSEKYSFLYRGNTNQYMILGEMYLTSPSSPEDSFYFPLERDMDFFKNKKEVYRSNRNILQSHFGYGPNGQNYAENKIAIVEVPIELLKEYGGDLERSEVLNYLDYFSQSSLNKIVKYVHPTVRVKYEGGAESIKFNFEWPGPDCKIEIQKKKNGEFITVDTLSEEEGVKFFWSDEEAVSNSLNVYRFRVLKNNIKYPFSEEYEAVIE